MHVNPNAVWDTEHLLLRKDAPAMPSATEAPHPRAPPRHRAPSAVATTAQTDPYPRAAKPLMSALLWLVEFP